MATFKTLDQQLYEACEAGEAEEVKQLLTHPIIHPNCETNAQTPFWIACCNGRTEVVKVLLSDERVLVNKANYRRQTPFWIACRNRGIEVAKLLLNDERVDLHKADKENDTTPFWISCQNGLTEVVRLLLNDEKIDVNKVDKENGTPLYTACFEGHIEIVKLLLNDERVDINKANSNDQTPFWIACYRRHIEIVKLLLSDERIDINKKNQEKLKQNGNVYVFSISQQTNIGTPFLLACRNEVIEIIQYILASGREVDINEKDNEGNTAISLVRRQIERIEQQQQQRRMFGSDPALLEALKKKQIEIIEFLESFEKNPTETRTIFRNQLGLPDINFFDGNKRGRRKIDEEKKVVVEDRKNQEPKHNRKGTEYEIEYNHELFVLQTTTKTLPEFENAIKSKLKIEQNANIRMYLKRKGKLIVLDDVEYLKEGMTVKVSMISQFQPNPGNQIEHFQLKNWNEIVFLSQGANDEYRIEIDPDEIPPQIKNQIVQLMQKSSKLETCLRSRLTPSNIVFQIDFVSRNRADKVFEQLVDILESN